MQRLTHTRPGARGALLCEACIPITGEWVFGPWPEGVPVQIHGMDKDPFLALEGDIDAVLLAHGSADTVTRPGETWAYVARARPLTSVTALEISGGDHPMLLRLNVWHAVAAEFARLSFGLPAGPEPTAVAVRAPGPGEAGWIMRV